MLTTIVLLQAAFPQPALVSTALPDVPVRTQAAESDGKWTRDVNAGFTKIEGNTESTNAAATAIYGWEGGQQKWELAAVYAATRQETPPDSGVSTTTSRLFHYAGLYDYFFTADKNIYGYAKASHRTNRPDGLQKRLDGGAGLGYRFDLYEEANANIEAGASYVIDEKVGLEEEKAVVLRGAYDLDTPLSEDLSLRNLGEYLTGDSIETFQHELALRWTMNSSVYLQFGYTMYWDNYPAAGFDTTDRIWVLVLGASF